MALVGMSARYPWQPRLPVSVGAGPVARTYEEFQAHIATLAPNTTPRSTFVDALSGPYRVTMTDFASPVMTGTSWNSAFCAAGSVTNVTAIVLHGLPSAVEATNQVGRQVLVQLASVANQAFISLNRNGYTSNALPAPTTAKTLTRLLYWDGTQAQEMIPSTGTGPTPYTW